MANLITRRQALRLGLLSGIAAGVGVIYQSTAPVGFGNWFRWMLRGQQARFGPPSLVGLVRVDSYDAQLLPALRRVWSLGGGPDVAGARVLVKPNLVDHLEGHPTFTDPRLAEGVIALLRELGAAEVVVGEGTTFRRDARAILIATGYEEMLRRNNVPFVDLNYDDLVSIPLKGGYARMRSLFVARTVHESDVFVSLPKLKTHHWTGLSASIKNLFGIVPGVKYGWPKNTLHIRGIPAFLAELLDSLPTPRRMAIVDGIVAMEGDGPLYGEAVALGAIVAGTDLVAVDSTCARLVGMDPAQLEYLAFAAWAGLGQLDLARIKLGGEEPSSLARVLKRPPNMQ